MFDDEGNQTDVIYNPPHLANTQNIRVELRKEQKHARPHVHVIKKGKDSKGDGLSIALDDFDILAGKEHLKLFSKAEYEAVTDFLLENQEKFIKIYETLRGDL